MSKRNFILLIIILAIVAAAVSSFLYFKKSPTPGTITDSGGTNFFSYFNPFRSNIATPSDQPPATDQSSGEPIVGGELPASNLKKVSSMPVAGFAIFMKERLKDVPVVTQTPAVLPETPAEPAKKPVTKPTPPPTEFVPALRYVERATGNIYQTFADKIEERRFSATIIPKIYEAYFGLGANSVILRRLKTDEHTIETFVGNLPKEKLGEDTAVNEIKGSFLPDNITDVSVSSDTSKLFYLLNVGNSAIGTILNLADAKKTQIFDSAFTEWLSSWQASKTVTLTTKPSGRVPGYMYMIDTDKKNLTQVLGSIGGLTTLMSPSGKLILYADSSLSLSVYHTDTKTSTLLGLRTLPEKCVWGQTSESIYCAVPVSIEGATYPDDWYKGEVAFSDQIWKITPYDGRTAIIADPLAMAGGEDTDGIKLALDASENYLFFVNKKDSFLWELSLR